ncbi:MAG: hypothetical protein JXB07_14275 [Anaerolineae bacterium]|nr:hypothetical protein [Anaerolineae bacterium]
MRKISEIVHCKLSWVQPSALKQEYELRADEELAATLSFKNIFGSLAKAESADGCWTFKRIGFWETKATIRACDGDTDIAVYKNNTWNNGGTLELPDGRKYFASLNFWATRYEFKNELDDVLLRYTKIGGVAHFSAQLDIMPSAVNVAELPWMAMLGWYLPIMIYRDSAAAVAATIAAR